MVLIIQFVISQRSLIINKEIVPLLRKSALTHFEVCLISRSLQMLSAVIIISAAFFKIFKKNHKKKDCKDVARI